MKHTSPASYAESYVNDGYLMVPDVVSPEECDEIKEEMLRIFRGEYNCAAIPPMDESATETEILDRIMCVGEPLFKTYTNLTNMVKCIRIWTYLSVCCLIPASVSRASD